MRNIRMIFVTTSSARGTFLRALNFQPNILVSDECGCGKPQSVAIPTMTLPGFTSHNFPPTNQMYQRLVLICSKLRSMRTFYRLLRAKKHAKEIEDLNWSQVERIELGRGLKLRRLSTEQS